MKKSAQKNKRTPAKAAPQKTSRPQPAASNENLSLAEVKELIELIAEKQYTEFELQRGSFRLRLQRGDAFKTIIENVQASPAAPAAQVVAPVAAPPVAAPPPAPPPPEEEALEIITSPIVGTFYRSSNPNAAPFVNIGDSVAPGKTLCIIEAMKLMNEIPAEISGTVAKIFVENAQPVEYGQPLFGIKV